MYHTHTVSNITIACRSCVYSNLDNMEHLWTTCQKLILRNNYWKTQWYLMYHIHISYICICMISNLHQWSCCGSIASWVGAHPNWLPFLNGPFLRVMIPIYPYNHLETWTSLDSRMESKTVLRILNLKNHINLHKWLVFRSMDVSWVFQFTPGSLIIFSHIILSLEIINLKANGSTSFPKRPCSIPC